MMLNNKKIIVLQEDVTLRKVPHCNFLSRRSVLAPNNGSRYQMSLGLASQECDVFHQGQFINIQSKGACEDSYEILLEHRVTHWTGNLLSHSDELCHVSQKFPDTQ